MHVSLIILNELLKSYNAIFLIEKLFSMYLGGD